MTKDVKLSSPARTGPIKSEKIKKEQKTKKEGGVKCFLPFY